MTVSIAWNDLLEKEIEFIEQNLLTKVHFDNIIKNLVDSPLSPLTSFFYEVQGTTPYVTFTLGAYFSEVHDAQSYKIADNRGTVCRLHTLWKSQGFVNAGETNSNLLRLFIAFWKPQFRTESAGMLDMKRDENITKLSVNTIQQFLAKKKNSSLLFCDLDNFGQVNKQLSQAVGDRIIKELGAKLEESCMNSGVLLHNGGDEFLILLPGGNPEDATDLSYHILKDISQHDFNIGEIKIGISIGMSSTKVDSSLITLENLIESANTALVTFVKKEGKGMARFCYIDPDTDSQNLNDDLKLALALVKSQVFSDLPFANIWLNCISKEVYECIKISSLNYKLISDTVDQFLNINRVPVEYSALFKCRSSYSQAVNLSPRLHLLDIPFAIAHAIFLSMLTSEQKIGQLSVKYNLTEKYVKLLLNEKTVWELSDNEPEEFSVFDFGFSPKYTHGAVPAENLAARAILIKIGHEKLEVPPCLFAEKIIIDDRPTSGGGLPDFWEATIARLVTQIIKNPNVAVLYILGNRSFAHKSVEKLQNLEEWKSNEELFSFKTGISTKNIRTAATLLSGKVVCVDSEIEMIQHLYTLLLPEVDILPIDNSSLLSGGKSRFLKRELLIDKMLLQQEDGCRVRTIAEAYPVILDIARHAYGEETIRDQAGQELKELMDFKVHLTNPREDLVPLYHYSDKDSLEEYFNSNFIAPTGHFGAELINSGQLKAVLAHVARVISDRESQFATRRAILVIPHVIKTPDHISPLGLVSVRIIPRFSPNRVKLYYSFTWRTVEALVGFPYSIYGSVKYSMYLTDEIKRLVDPEIARGVDMADVSYIAHSLHMFMDDFGQNIARRIVDDASL